MLTKLSELDTSTELQVISERAYLQAGASTFIVPNGVSKLYVAVFGAGGSGGAYSGGHSTGGGGGGFAGGYLKVKAGEKYNVTVGAGGVGVKSSTLPGNAGGSSSFGTLLSATGGLGGNSQANSTTLFNGGTGGYGSIDTSVIAGIVFNGGRGGNKEAGVTGTSQHTGGGASGSPFGAGGNGGDIKSSVNIYAGHYTGGGGWSEGNGGDIAIAGTNIYSGGGGLGSNGSAMTYSGVPAPGGTGGGAYSDATLMVFTVNSSNYVQLGGTGLNRNQTVFTGWKSVLDGTALTGQGGGRFSPFAAIAQYFSIDDVVAGNGGGGGAPNAATIDLITATGGIAGGGGACGFATSYGAEKSKFGGGSGAINSSNISYAHKNGNGGGAGGASVASTSNYAMSGGDGAVIILW